MGSTVGRRGLPAITVRYRRIDGRMSGLSKLEHPWDVTHDEAIALQLRLREQVIIRPLEINEIRSITALRAVCQPERVVAVAMTLRREDWLVEDHAGVTLTTNFPYTPGLLAFTAGPAMLKAVAQLNRLGDVIMVEGHGIAHPRRFGVACHLGLALDMPTMGCGRSFLIGKALPLPQEAGSASPVMDGDEMVGFAYRSRSGVKPIYISIGHRMDAESLLALTRVCLREYRLPEPMRRVRIMTKEYLE